MSMNSHDAAALLMVAVRVMLYEPSGRDRNQARASARVYHESALR